MAVKDTLLGKAGDDLQGNIAIACQYKPWDNSCHTEVPNKNLVRNRSWFIIRTATTFAGQYILRQTQQTVYSVHHIGLDQNEIREDRLALLAKLVLSLLTKI